MKYYLFNRSKLTAPCLDPRFKRWQWLFILIRDSGTFIYDY